VIVLDDQEIAVIRKDPIVEHRFSWFVQLGFSMSQAATLAEQGADHHEAEGLLRRGCPRDIAFDILAA